MSYPVILDLDDETRQRLLREAETPRMMPWEKSKDLTTQTMEKAAVVMTYATAEEGLKDLARSGVTSLHSVACIECVAARGHLADKKGWGESGVTWEDFQKVAAWTEDERNREAAEADTEASKVMKKRREMSKQLDRIEQDIQDIKEAERQLRSKKRQVQKEQENLLKSEVDPEESP
jgi:hypothetical protein